MMNYQEENQTSQQYQDRPSRPPTPLTLPVLYRSIANERIYDDDVTLPQVQNPTELPVIYRSTTNERIYDDDIDILSQVQYLTGLPELYRTIANERIDDDIILHQLVKEADVSNNLSHHNDILDLSQEMTYMGIEPP